MKHFNVVLVFAFILSFTLVNAQNDAETHENKKTVYDYNQDTTSKFSLITFGGVGYAIMDNENQPDYNLDASTADILLHYTIGNRWGIATGLGFNRLSGSGFDNTGNNFYHTRGTLKIPVLLSGNYNLSQRVRLVANIGLYAQTIIKDEFEFAGGTSVGEVYEGWGFGLQSGIGLSYNIDSKISLGIMINTQGDFNRGYDADTTVGPPVSQRIKSINTVGLLFNWNL
ncbi:outer membrane beta-barrel protein [Kordia sp. TARA_039_SRF]|nr:outer membrane beta-barrel protein [Kordia sp. TARA_039_SRF]